MMSLNISSSSKLDQELSDIGSELVGLMSAAHDGIISGLEVTVVGNTLSVSAGSAFIGGTLFQLSAIDGLRVDMIPGSHGFIFVKREDTVEYGTDVYNRQVVISSNPKASIIVTSDVIDGLALAYFEVVNHLREDALGEIVTVESSAVSHAAVPKQAPHTIQVDNAWIISAVVTEYGRMEPYTHTPGSVAPYCFTFENSGVFRFHSSNSNAKLSINYKYKKPVEEQALVLDTSNSRFVSMRPAFTMKDIRHCSTSGIGNNAHGVTFDDMNQSFPLHSQVFDTGFSTTSKGDVDGMLGSLFVESFAPFSYNVGLALKHRFLLDMFGLITGTPGRQYIRLKYTPLVVTYVVNKLTRAPLWFQVYDNALAFDINAIFDASEIEVGYTAVKCLDTVIHDDNALTLLGGTDTIVISEGHEVNVPDDVFVNLGGYIGVPLQLTVSVDSNAEPVLLPGIVDSAKISSRSSSSFQKPFELGGQAQLAITLRNTPLRNALKPPVGRLSVVTDASLIYGRRRFIYTYSKEDTILSIVNKATTEIQSEYNLSGSYVRRGVEIVERDAWMYVANKKRVVVANSIYENVVSPKFLLWTGAALSPRNRRGYTEVVGSASAPIGPRSQCLLTLTQRAVQDKDTFTYTASNTTVVKTYRTMNATFFGETIETIAESLQQILGSEPLWYSSGYQVESAGNKVILTTTNPNADLVVYCANACVRVTNFALSGDAYIASIEILEPNLQAGDFVSVRVDASSSPIVKNWRTPDVFESSAFDLSVLRDAFNDDSVFSSAGAMATLTDSGLTITSGDAGSLGNSNTFSTTSSAVTVNPFSGGLDTAVPDFKDISGATLLLEDEQDYDKTGVFHIYSTGNLDSGASESEYFHVGDVAQVQDTSTYQITLDSSSFDTTDIVDLDQEFSLSILVSGTDASGSSVSETVTLTPLNFCEYLDATNGETNELQFVRTSNVFASVTQWAVVDKRNVGTTEVVLLSELTSGSRDLYEVATINWNGSVVQGKTDRRKFVPSTTYQDPSLVVGEALGTMALLFKAVL